MTRSCGKRHAQERREETSARQYVSLCLSRFCCAVEEISERTSWITTAWQKVIRKTSDLYKYSRMINDCPEVPEPVIGFFRVTSYQLQVPVTSESALVSFWLNVLQVQVKFNTGMSVVFYCLIATYGRSHLL